VTPTLRSATLSAVIAFGLACDAQAQPPGHPPGEAPARMRAMHEARERQHAADLRTILRLRPDQEGALTAFLQSQHPPMGPERGRRDEPSGAPMTTPQALDAMARREAEHAAMRQKHADALKTFYAALSPEQRPVFDALQRMRGHGGERGGWGHRGFGGRPGGPPGDD